MNLNLYEWIILSVFSIENSYQQMPIECNSSLLSALDDSASSLFVIGDRRNRFLVNDQEYDYFCSVEKSWVNDILDYIRLCLPRFSVQKLMTRKLGNQIKKQADLLCNLTQTTKSELYANSVCLNKVINELHYCAEDMIDYLSLVQNRVVGIKKLTHLCCGYLQLRNCTRLIFNTHLKRTCHNSTEWFDQLMSGYSHRFFKQFCVTEEHCSQNICNELEKFSLDDLKQFGKNRDKSVLPGIVKILITTDV